MTCGSSGTADVERPNRPLFITNGASASTLPVFKSSDSVTRTTSFIALRISRQFNDKKSAAVRLRLPPKRAHDRTVALREPHGSRP